MLRLLSFLLLLTGIGCGEESDSHHHHGHHDHMGHGGDPSKDDADTYVAGLEKVGTSGHFTVRLTRARQLSLARAYIHGSSWSSDQMGSQ